MSRVPFIIIDHISFTEQKNFEITYNKPSDRIFIKFEGNHLPIKYSEMVKAMNKIKQIREEK